MDKRELDLKRIYNISTAIGDEFVRAVEEHGHPYFNSYHEGYAVIKEELDELWEEVKKYPNQDNKNLKKEAIQIGAMALRFVYDLLDREKKMDK
ncbi:hypothetical protein ES708_19500 [subsurface metagenome]